MGHAPGPWRVSNSEDDAYVMHGKPCAVIAADGSVVACNTTYYPKALDAENADLIAAAPDLLAALEWLHLGKGKPVDIAAAIARATGAGA